MPDRQHHYTVALEWTGNRGPGTSSYAAFSRNHDLRVPGQGPIASSSDPAFRGDKTRMTVAD